MAKNADEQRKKVKLTRTENNILGTKCGINSLPPPTGTKFDHVTPGGIKLAHNRVQTRGTEMVAWRQLKKKAAYMGSEQIRDITKILDQRFRSLETLGNNVTI